MEAIETLKSYLGSLNVGRPITHENLTLFPVTDGHSPAHAYLLLEEALATGKLRVMERGVSCVEQGLWAFAGREMRRGSITYPDLRKLKHRSVHESLHFGGSYRSNQGRIWQSVQAKLSAMDVSWRRRARAGASAARRGETSAATKAKDNLPLTEKEAAASICACC